MPEQDISQYFAYLLASAYRHMRIELSNSLGEEAFTEEHWRILRVLSDEAGRSMGELAELVLLNGPALTKNVDKLVSRGLVQRAPDNDDSRRVLVFISDLGRDVIVRLNERVDAHQETIEDALGPRSAARLKRLLEKLIKESRNC
jgi:DNA-binding MarR family transcriptional regulator